MPRFEPLTALRVQAQAAGARWANVYRGDRLLGRRRRDRGAASGAGRLGAAEGAERRLDRARRALARRLGAADRRHRQGGRADARRRGSAGAAAGPEGSASRQPDVEQPGIPAGAPSRRSRCSAPAGRTISATPRRRCCTVSRHRRGDLPHRSGRRRDARHGWAIRSMSARSPADASLATTTRNHEDTKDTKDMTCSRITSHAPT